MKAVVIEDSRLAREGLVRMLADFPQLTVVGEANHPSTARTLLKETRPDVLFLDIHMPGESGFELLESIDYAPKIIFTTAYSEYAIRSFDFNTVDYLLKPISYDRLAKAIQKLAIKEEESEESDIQPEQTQPKLDINSRIFIKDGDRCHLVALSSIRYIESCKNYVQMFFDDKKPYVKKSMNNIESRLPKEHFFRVSRQHIVNLQSISEMEESMSGGYILMLNDGKRIELSRRNASELKDLLSI